MAREFVATNDLPVTQACIDVAGPVLARQAKGTNLPWLIDAETLRRELNVDALWLLNDLEATAWAVPILQSDELHTLHRVNRRSKCWRWAASISPAGFPAHAAGADRSGTNYVASVQLTMAEAFGVHGRGCFLSPVCWAMLYAVTPCSLPARMQSKPPAGGRNRLARGDAG